MPSSNLVVNETDIVRLILEFLQNRELNISMLSVERETGIINGIYSDDMLFLRQLILDGQWDDVIEFVQPLGSIEGFNLKKVQYMVMKHKYLELLCIKSEPSAFQNYELTPEKTTDLPQVTDKLYHIEITLVLLPINNTNVISM